ncbi:MAG: hypothetical protein LKG11_02845 [Bacilli bacterium]|jgi:hypothetical protein|nr:hypothetical protein [Bacilli bacterium]
MNELLLNILSVVVTAVIIPLISLLGTKLYQLINSKIKDQKGATLIKKATDIVLNAVRSVFQTYVESLKKSGGFDSAAQAKAFNMAKTIIVSQLTEDVKAYLAENYGDLEEWISTQIEASINILKN